MAVQLSFPGLVLPASLDPSDPPAASHWSDLWSWPDIDTATLCTHACALGAAGEALVDSLLLRYGLVPLPVPPGLAADRLVICGRRLLRLQVKSTSSRRGDGYHVNAQRGYRGAPQGRRDYEATDYDLLAIAILPEMVCRFTTSLRSRHRVGPGEIAGLRADPQASLASALLELGVDPDAGVDVTGAGPARDPARDPARNPDCDPDHALDVDADAGANFALDHAADHAPDTDLPPCAA